MFPNEHLSKMGGSLVEKQSRTVERTPEKPFNPFNEAAPKLSKETTERDRSEKPANLLLYSVLNRWNGSRY